MKSLYAVLISLTRDLLDTWRHPGSRSGLRTPARDSEALAGKPPEASIEDLHIEALASEFPRELFAQLLLELPEHRKLMAESFTAGNYRRLRENVHQLLGATAYCDVDDLEQGLRQLRTALKTDDARSIQYCFHHAMQTIDNTLHNSGYRTHPQ